MKTTKTILIWSLVIATMTQGFGQTLQRETETHYLENSSGGVVLFDTVSTDQLNRIFSFSSKASFGGYDGKDAKIIDSKIENGIFEIEIDFTEFDGYMCMVLYCDYDHKKHNRVKYYFNAQDFSFIRKEVGELKEVMTKQWIYKQ